MKNPDNYYLEHFSINRSQENKLYDRYLISKIESKRKIMLLTDEQLSNFILNIENANSLEEKSIKEALIIYLDLWDRLPIPKNKQPNQISNWLIDCIFEAYFRTENYIEAEKWAIEGLNNDTAEHDSYEYIQIGRVSYELKKYKEALNYFHTAYQRGKKRAFQEFDKKYWKFYLKNKKKLSD